MQSARTNSRSAESSDLSNHVDRESQTDVAVLRRSDLAAVWTSYQRESRRWSQWLGVGIGIAALGASAVVISIASRLEWPTVVAPIALAGGWTVTLTSFIIVQLRERRALARFQIHCPACGKPLLESNLRRKANERVTLMIATGNCTHCVENVLAP